MTATTEAERRAAEVIRRWADQIAAARRDGDHLRAQDAEVHDLQTYLLGDRQDAA